MAELTNEQVESVLKVAEENVSPAIEQLRAIQNGDIPPEVLEEETEEEKYAQIDPITGKVVGYTGAPSSLDSAEDINDVVDDDLVKELDEKMGQPKVVGSAVKSIYGDTLFTDADFVTISKLVRQRSAGEKVKYEDAPITLQRKILHTIAEQGNTYVGLAELKTQLLESFLDNISMNIYSTESAKTMQDLSFMIGSVMKKEGKEVNESSIAKKDKVIRETLPILVERYKDEKPELAATYSGIIKGYEQAYSMEEMFASYYSGKPKIKKIDIDKLDRLCFEFNAKYTSSKWSIKNTSMLVPILDRDLRDDIDIQDIKAFVAIFIKYTENMKPSNIADHAFMSFFVDNIASLDIYRKTGYTDGESEYYETYLNNIYRFIDVIAERRKAREATDTRRK